jgi:hypothetical protein
MKPSTSFLLISTAVAFVSVASAQTWLASFQQSLKSLIEIPFRKSTVPQFILDARHPWILANQRKLERLSNAEAFLCSGLDFETNDSTEIGTEAFEKGLELPPDIFDYLEIDNNRVGISRPGWQNALERLGEMKRCQRALKQAKRLEVNIFVHSVYLECTKILEPSQPPEWLLTLFGDVLESLTNLETFNWGLGHRDTHHFEEAFTSRNLTLPSIKNLQLGPSSYYLVGMCPNLERLENGNGYSSYHGHRSDQLDWRLMLIQAASSTPKLKRFAMAVFSDGWTPALVSGAFSLHRPSS